MSRWSAIFCSISALFGAAQAVAAPCDVTRIEATVGGRVFHGSAVPLQVSGHRVLVSADHVLPFELGDASGLSIRAVWRNSAGVHEAGVVVHRRDWSSDLLVLAADAGSEAEFAALSPCRLAVSAPIAGAALQMQGYVAGTYEKSAREAQLLDPAAPEVRVSARIHLLKAAGAGEKGMSGGALFQKDGSVAGLLLQDWVSANHEARAGVYALPAAQLEDAVASLLAQRALEMPLPFQIRRGVPEMSALGFRFRASAGSLPDRPGLLGKGGTQSASSMRMRMRMRLFGMGGGGGHPDGIGGEAPDATLEVVGLSGDAVVPAWEPMAKILRRIQAEGGSEMLVRRTAQGMPAGTLVALGRLLIENPDSPPDLDFMIRSIRSTVPSGAVVDLDALSQQAVILSSLLAQKNPDASSVASQLRQHYVEWIRGHEIAELRALVRDARQANPTWNSVAEANPDCWKTVVELQVVLMRIEKALGKVTS